MLEKISGYKTYICMIAYGVEQILSHAGVLHVGPDTLGMLEAFLITGAGISLRAGVKKAETGGAA